MKSILKTRTIPISILLLALASVFQPFLVLGAKYGRSNNCLNCSILGQSFSPSIIYLVLPFTAIYLFTKKMKISPLLQALTVVVYFVPVSFVTLTVPLFGDRIAAWSTFSDEEIWNTAMYMARPSMAMLSCIMFILLTTINRTVQSNKSGFLLDQNGDIDRVD